MGKSMDKRAFLKTACGLGFCSCVPAVFGTGQSEPAQKNPETDKLREENWRLNWRLNHARNQLARLMELLEPELDPSVRKRILQELGRNCAKSLGWAEKYKGNPEGFFEQMKSHSGEQLAFDPTGKIITIVTRERDCDCPLVDSSKMPPGYCDCSIGWQKETYETILGKSVEVDLKESVLRGSKRCVFEVRIT
jgi:predicted hydrocarbon binding protein